MGVGLQFSLWCLARIENLLSKSVLSHKSPPALVTREQRSSLGLLMSVPSDVSRLLVSSAQVRDA